MKIDGPEATPNWRRCLNHILAYQPDGWRHLVNKQLGGLLLAFTDSPQAEPPTRAFVAKELAVLGLALVRLEELDENDAAFNVDYLGLSPRHPTLAKIFENTDWSARRGADGAWINAIAQAPEGMWKRGRFRIGGAREYGLLVRLDAVLEREDEENSE